MQIRGTGDRFRLTIRRMMLVIAMVALVLSLLLLVDEYLIPGARGAGSFEVEMHIVSASGREVLGVTYEKGRSGPDLAEMQSLDYRRTEGDGTTPPRIRVRFGVEYYGTFRNRVRYSQEREFLLRIDFADGSQDFVAVQIPDRHRFGPVKSLTIPVE